MRLESQESKVEGRELTRLEMRCVCSRPSALDSRRRRKAFTLLEVLIAIGIFFIVAFSILELMTRSLAAARALQFNHADAGMLAAKLSLTNSLVEGSESGDFDDIYPDIYPDYRWEREIYEVGTNGLYRVDFLVMHRVGRKEVPTTMSILMYRPASVAGANRGLPRR